MGKSKHLISRHKQQKKYARKKRLKPKQNNKGKKNVVNIQTGKKLTISACMMVKDEEHNLHRCLSSIKDLVDEIIVVDTGSTDKSIEICKSYGAKVYFHKWADDFSLHRNQSIGYATSDWVLIIDADEEAITTPSTYQKLRKTLCDISSTFDCASILFKDIQKGMVIVQQYSARLFRREKIKYSGIIHNQPKIKEKATFGIDDFYIKHYGYDLSPEKAKQKYEKTRKLLYKSLEQDPNDYTAYFYLAQNYAQTKDYQKAVEYGERYLEYKDQALRDGKFMVAIYYCIFHCYKELNNPRKANEWLNMGIQDLPNDIDLALALTEYGVWQRKSDIAMVGARRFIELYDQYSKDPSLKGNRFIYTHVPEALSFCHFHFILIVLHELVGALEQLHDNFANLAPQYAYNLANDFAQMFTRFKMPELIEKYLPQSAKPTVPNIADFGVKFNKLSENKVRNVA